LTTCRDAIEPDHVRASVAGRYEKPGSISQTSLSEQRGLIKPVRQKLFQYGQKPRLAKRQHHSFSADNIRCTYLGVIFAPQERGLPRKFKYTHCFLFMIPVVNEK
jgi:hypothetical protein